MAQLLTALLENPQEPEFWLFIVPFAALTYLAVHYYRIRPQATDPPADPPSRERFVTREEYGAAISALRSEHRKLAKEISAANAEIARIDGRLEGRLK